MLPSHSQLPTISVSASSVVICPQEGCEVLWWACVCLSVCLNISETTRHNFSKLVCRLPMTIAQCHHYDTLCAVSGLTLLGGRKGIMPVKKLSSDCGLLVWLIVWGEVRTCLWSSWCHCHSLSLASVKCRLILFLWYQFTQVVSDKGSLNMWVCMCVCVSMDVVMFSCNESCGCRHAEVSRCQRWMWAFPVIGAVCLTSC